MISSVLGHRASCGKERIVPYKYTYVLMNQAVPGMKIKSKFHIRPERRLEIKRPIGHKTAQEQPGAIK